MDFFTREELQSLLAGQHGLAVSIFLPTHRAGREIRQDPIRLKNLLRRAEAALIASNLRRADARELLAPARELVERKHFWRYQDSGLAVFLSGGFFRYFRLPLPFQQLVVVADRFHVKPLLALLTGDSRFYVLALSQNQVRLLEGTRYTVSEVDLEGVPRSIREAFKNEEFQTQLQLHTTSSRRRGKRPAIFHGHGAGMDDAKVNLLRYFRAIDKGLQHLLRNQRAPLVLAGVDYLFPIYMNANTYPQLLEQGIRGNPDALSAAELHAGAWNVVQPYFKQAQEQAAAQYRHPANANRTLSDLRKILPAAYQGGIEVLFVAVGVQQWGNFDPDRNLVALHKRPEPGDEDLLNLAATQAILHGTCVYAVAPSDMPDDCPIAALLRY
jgi:hypothetical protein